MLSADSSFGYHENPLYRKITPPQQVWVNLAAAYPLPRDRDRYVPGGLDLVTSVPGRLHIWAMTTTGHWVGWITYDTPAMRGVAGWVLGAALVPRDEQPARRDRPSRWSS